MAVGDVTEARVYGPAQPGTVTAVLYTVPASRRLTIKQILLANTDGSTQGVTIGVNGTSAADQIVPDVAIPSHTVESLDTVQVLEAGDTIDGLQDLATAITVTISGFLLEV